MAGRIVIAIILLLALFGFANYATHENAETQTKETANAIVAASQLNQQWEDTFDKTGKYPNDPSFHKTMYGVLVNVPQTHPDFLAARALADKFSARQTKIDAVEAKRQAALVADDADGRKKHASYLDYVFLKDGRDAHFNVSGPKNTTLELTYILVNRPFVFKLQSETQFFEDAWKAGFKKIILRDYAGYGGNAWTFENPNLNQKTSSFPKTFAR